MTKSKNASDMDWMNREAKRYADLLAFRAMAPWVLSRGSRPLRVLSFPAAEWMWERSMSDLFRKTKFEFTGIERDARVHKSMVANAGIFGDSNFQAHPLPISFREWLDVGSTVDMVYLDWMGTWSEDKQRDVHALLRRTTLDPDRDSMLRVTISMTRGQPARWDGEFESCFHITDLRGGGKELPKWKLYGTPSRIIDAGAEFGRVLKLVSAHVYPSYADKLGKSNPEASYLFRVSTPKKKRQSNASKP